MDLHSRLYAILDVDLVDARGLTPLAVLAAWLDAGVRLIQLRAKTLPSGRMLDLADSIARRAREAGAVFLVNDRADVASLSHADGVHLGQDDLSPADARRIVGDRAIVGRSTHNDVQVAAACAEPVDYVAVGPVFRTTTKAAPDPVIGLEGVRRAFRPAAAARLPLVAIGGITLETAPEVIRAGASAVAVIGDLLAGDPALRARQYLKVLEELTL